MGADRKRKDKDDAAKQKFYRLRKRDRLRAEMGSISVPRSSVEDIREAIKNFITESRERICRK